MSKIVGNIVGNALDLSNLNTNGGSAELDSEIFKKDIIIPETSLALTEYSPYTRTYIHSDVVFKDGETYIVNWEGTKYTCVGKQVSGGVILGNGGVFGYSATDDPFCIRYIENPVGVPDNLEILSVAALTSATVEITTPPMIDPRYIPNMYYEEEAELLPETEVTFADNDGMFVAMVENPPFELVGGQSYKVVYNGNEYLCVCDYGISAIGNIGLIQGGESTGEPFIITIENGMLIIVSLTGDTIATISIQTPIVNPMPFKFLPQPELFDFIEAGIDNITPPAGAVNVSYSVEEYPKLAGVCDFADRAYKRGVGRIRCIFKKYDSGSFSDSIDAVYTVNVHKRHTVEPYYYMWLNIGTTCIEFNVSPDGVMIYPRYFNNVSERPS